MDLRQTVLEAKDICKSFYDNLVLDHVNFSCTSGEIHTLVGENGAGKSTLMRIFSGVYQPTSGELYLNGKPVKFTGTLQAQQAGVSIIHQEFNLVPHMSIAENIFLGRQLRKKGGNLDFPAMRRRTEELSRMMRMELEPDAPVCSLTVAQQQMVEIMKAIELDTQIIIMDEPTAALTPVEVSSLFAAMRRLRDEGRTIIYISHRLNEVFDISDRITVLKDGVMAATLRTEETTKDEVVSLMVGRKLDNIFPPRDEAAAGEVRLQAEGLVIAPGKGPASFSVRAGEILGVTGLEGQGQRELLRALFGLHRLAAGKIFIDGQEVRIRSTREAMAHGVTFLTDDRKNEGLCLDLPIYRNISLPVFRRLKTGPFLTVQAERQETQRYMELMNIKAESSAKLVRKLSGGNQQKVLLGKCLSPAPKVLLVHEPTRGIDVAAKIEIYTLLKKLAREEQVAVVMVSSDLMEVLNVSDRILVVYGGGISGELAAADATEESVMRLATGVAKEAAV
ncbi:sugar ABC transporter ATP-binding protein [Agathobaculum sp. NSJ-28]|uniref:Sugar ABC transporter ATP-binding protein n=1 Tax=Agathobaculum faecis TaxID=2763013 RepID=A0A923LUJ1_9FIRM|nr:MULTISPECIES: sugar ABC transporter ATP-binding protein [Butyricicoccaceae]MBC5724249.1 sugar ABC transporter ATP-binding protein [Agathobaculum faecis]MBS6883460.1 sugar ABC transporter ATP-binding protein [Clostridiaceae bacterium]WOC75447.1 sugar ABC transporter ATP-binding protein [Intestinibacillus sp. NTUH-41-i26]